MVAYLRLAVGLRDDVALVSACASARHHSISLICLLAPLVPPHLPAQQAHPRLPPRPHAAGPRHQHTQAEHRRQIRGKPAGGGRAARHHPVRLPLRRRGCSCSGPRRRRCAGGGRSSGGRAAGAARPKGARPDAQGGCRGGGVPTAHGGPARCGGHPAAGPRPGRHPGAGVRLPVCGPLPLQGCLCQPLLLEALLLAHLLCMLLAS